MPSLSTRLHAILDYLVAAILIALPWLLGFAAGGGETWVPVVIGLAILAYSLCTDYELGVVKRIQMPVHLWIDSGVGLFLVISPWLFGFDQEVWVPHLVIGVIVLVTSFFSNTIPGYERRSSGGDRG